MALTPGQTIKYGDYEFPYSKIRVRTTPIYAPDGRTLERMQLEINVTGVIAGATNTAFKTALYALRSAVSQARRSILITAGTDTIFSYTVTQDDKWGPIPGVLEEDDFAGGLACKYRWSVTCYRKECWGEGVPQTPSFEILSAVASYDFAIDENGYTVRVVSGTLTVRDGAQPADKFRYSVVPSLPAGYRRTSQSYSQSEDQLTLRYSVTDTEVTKTLPAPITGGDADWAISVDEMGAIIRYSLSGWYAAPKSVPKTDIIQRVVELVESRFPMELADTLIFTKQEVRENIFGDNRIDFSFSAYTAFVKHPGAETFSIDATVPGSTGAAVVIDPYGHGNRLRAMGAFIYDACDGGSVQGPDDEPPTGNVLSEGGPQPGGGGGGGDHGNVSADHAAAPYIAYHERISWELDNHVVVFQPKNTDGAPVVQQTALPSLHIVQAGYAVRVGKDASQGPVAPPPIVRPPNAYVMQYSIQPSNPVPMGDGTHKQYGIFWRYVLRFINARGAGLHLATVATWPIDARLADQTPESIANLPSEFA